MLLKYSLSAMIIFLAAASMFTVIAVAGIVNGQNITGNETKKDMPAGMTDINGSMLGNMTGEGNMTNESTQMMRNSS